MRRKSNVALYVVGVLCLIVAAVCLWAIFNKQWLMDWWNGKDYQPIGEMARIQRDLGLTDRGDFLFKASRPVLSEREDFNEKCREVMDGETAVLGCYTGGEIYVYNIEADELDGIRELTAAHELLHAVWERMGDEERDKLDKALNAVLSLNGEILDSELDVYHESQKREELFVRAGTEVANLPAELEKVYGEIFKDQDEVVGFYNKYIAVFREMKQEMSELKAEMEELNGKIAVLTEEYEKRNGQLNADIVSFNACAEVNGCFKSDAVFYARRGEIIAEQEELMGMYENISGLVNEYNALVEKYNADVTKTEELNIMMNSNKKPEEL